ncbi:methyl-accepting chemotaxis protein [Aureimonas sp. SK2]|uniref:methyl-accepting chemotaxis protein n=1 Tax=Aureimonas sp. SK2 TaxID=3015992 RepID=UPI002444AC12|nr:methyl-accepting chemotaxis protein [Aureimonas sp. SK2]
MMKKLRIATKIALIALFISSIGIGASIYGAMTLFASNAAYSDMIERLDKSAIYLARLNRSANAVGFAAYRSFAYSGTSQEAKSAAELAKEQLDLMQKYYGEAARRLTDEADALRAIKEQMDIVTSRAPLAVAAGLADNNDAGLAEMRIVNPAVLALSKQTGALNDRTIAHVTEMNARLFAQAASASWMLIGGTIVSAVFGLIAALWVSTKGITQPLTNLRDRMADLAAGNLETIVDGQDRGDEVGGMARAVQVFKDAAILNKRLEADAEAARKAEDARREAQAQADRAKAQELQGFVSDIETGFAELAAGNLTARMNRPVAAEFEPIRDQFNGSVEKLEQTIGAVVGSIGSIRTGLTEINVASNDLAQRTEQQAASLEETVAALGEVTRAVNETAENATQAQASAQSAQRNAQKGGEIVSRAIDAMQTIEQSSQKIGNIIGVIDEIAFQTNLLALNAGVEAARAGEAGRGFAVVAQEVRGLAQRSAEAAKEIKGLIEASSHQVGTGVELVTASGRSLEEIIGEVGEVSRVVSEIARRAQEQAVSLKEVSTAADQMDKVTQQNAAMVEQATAAAQTLANETDELARLIAEFKTAATANHARQSERAAQRTANVGRRAAPTASVARPVVQMKPVAQGNAALSTLQDNWEEF